MLHKLTVKNYVKYFIAALLVILFFFVVQVNTELGAYSTDEFKLTCKPNIGLSIITKDKNRYSYSREYSEYECKGLNRSTGQINFKFQKGNNYLVSLDLDGHTIISYGQSFTSMTVAMIWSAAFVVSLLLGADLKSIQRKRERETNKKELEQLIKEREAKEASDQIRIDYD